MGEGGSVTGHVHHVGVALQAGHKGGLQESGVEVVQLLPVAAVASVFAREDLGAGAGIVVIAAGIALEETLVAVEVLVH